MNDKIKELAEQSYEAATITTIDPFTQEVVVDYIDGTKLIFNKEKFAELLEKEFEAKYFSAGYIQGRSDGTIETVRECIDIAEQDYCHSWDQEWRKELSDSIKQHFGVEE